MGSPRGCLCDPQRRSHQSRTTAAMTLELSSDSQPGPLVASYTYKLGVIPLGTVILFVEAAPSDLNIANCT